MNNTSLASQTMRELETLVSNLLLLLSEKEKNVVLKRFNLQGNRRHTLEEIGQEFSVTRERIRQIEKSALSKMRRNVFNTSLKHLHDAIDGIVRDHGGLIREDDLHLELKTIAPPDKEVAENNLHLSIVLHEGLNTVGNTIDFHPYVKDQNLSSYSLKHASNQLVNQLQKYGDVKNLEKVYSDLGKVFERFRIIKSLYN